jgi:hypothetical protein
MDPLGHVEGGGAEVDTGVARLLSANHPVDRSMLLGRGNDRVNSV